MTPLEEELQAAHKRLSELREGGPAWSLSRNGDVVSGIYLVAESTDDQYAKLIVTLHRTIDAQLAILATARDDVGYSSQSLTEEQFTRCDEPNACHEALVLARAINGEAS